MSMNSLNLTLSDPLKAYVEERVASGEFATPGDFIRGLIRQDKERRRSGMEVELLEAMESRRLVISPQDLENGNLVSILREKIAKS